MDLAMGVHPKAFAFLFGHRESLGGDVMVYLYVLESFRQAVYFRRLGGFVQSLKVSVVPGHGLGDHYGRRELRQVWW